VGVSNDKRKKFLMGMVTDCNKLAGTVSRERGPQEMYWVRVGSPQAVVCALGWCSEV
jgi:hypothetical protein